jgi:molybdopterin-containing oxidoreductase family iron-sulfur binding subunit
MLHDGRGANKPWLLENADPVTKISWHSWVEVHPDVARKFDVRNGEILRVTSPHGTVEAPVYVYAGIHPSVVAMPLGFGHTEYGQFAKGRGVNALDLLGAPQAAFLPYVSTRVTIAKTGDYKKLATLEGTPRQLGRGIAEAISLDAAQKGLTIEQAYIAEGRGKHEINTEAELEAVKGWSAEQAEATQYGDYAAANPRWGMAIDLAKCTGCQACVTACYAENNIPTVGEGDPQGSGDDLAPDRAVLGRGPGSRRRRVGSLHPDAVPALYQRTLRAGLPGVCCLSHGGRAQRPGVQPLRGHPLLRQQLSLQGPVFQLV